MKDDHVYLLHIKDSITKIETYADVGKDEFMTVSHWQDAIIRNGPGALSFGSFSLGTQRK